MVNNNNNNNIMKHCDQCDKRIPKSQPQLLCSICNKFRHSRCQSLSKKDALHIIDLIIAWTCITCITDILPINAITLPKRVPSLNMKFKVKCSNCSGWSHSPSTLTNCFWCESSVHVKCRRGELGCINCCANMIPGFYFTVHEITGNYDRFNNNIHNPYDRQCNINLIGDTIDNTQHDNEIWNQVSDLLQNCKYKQQIHVQPSKFNELRILSMNICYLY